MIREIALILLLATPAAAQTVVPPLNAAQTKASTRANLVGKLADLTAQANAVSASLQANRVTATDDAAAADAASIIDLRSQVYDLQCAIATIDGVACASVPAWYRKPAILKNAISAQTSSTPLQAFGLTGTLTVPLTVGLQGVVKIVVPVTGLAAGDRVIVTPKASVPDTMVIASSWASGNGSLEVSVLVPKLLSVATSVSIPLDILAYR